MSNKAKKTEDSLRILCADLSLRCPGFAVLRYENGRITVEKLCHLSHRGQDCCHEEILAAIYDLITELSADVGKDYMTVGKLNTERRIRKLLKYDAFCFDHLRFRHSFFPFLL